VRCSDGPSYPCGLRRLWATRWFGRPTTFSPVNAFSPTTTKHVATCWHVLTSQSPLQPDDCAVLHLGNIVPYKGADLLLPAAEQVPSDTKMRILAVGACADDAYSELLQRLADGLAERVPLADNSRPRYAWGYPR
jgi:glycosyltransferase involved in cell wall biosynthesis